MINLVRHSLNNETVKFGNSVHDSLAFSTQKAKKQYLSYLFLYTAWDLLIRRENCVKMIRYTVLTLAHSEHSISVHRQP